MHRGAILFQRLFIAAAVLFSLGLIGFSLVRVPRKLLVPDQPGYLDAPVPKTDCPADVGNALGEEFLRKVERPAAIPAAGPIALVDETFSAAYDELYDRRDAYYGREIELSGYVMAQDGLEKGGFLVGRNLLWCCEADKYFIGFLAFTDGPTPSEGDCVHVRGTIEAETYTNPENGKTFTVPAIRASLVEPASDVSPLVYPN